MNIRDAIRSLDQLGPVTPITKEQADTIRRLVADMHDSQTMLEALGIEP